MCINYLVEASENKLKFLTILFSLQAGINVASYVLKYDAEFVYCDL